jgi:hypothetical protein
MEQERKVHVLSFGGGVNSTALLFLIKEKGMPLDEIIFADTGNELPETYEIIKQINPTIVKSELAKDLYDYLWNKQCLPSRMKRDCTSKFKISPIRKYLRNKYGKDAKFVTYIGIALEEAHRMRTSDVKYIENSYPLVDNKIDRNGCIEILKRNGFDNVIKSGCFFCPFTKKAGWIDLKIKHPELMQKAVALEKNCRNPKVTLGIRGEPTCNIFASCWL